MSLLEQAEQVVCIKLCVGYGEFRSLTRHSVASGVLLAAEMLPFVPRNQYSHFRPEPIIR